MNSDLLKRRVAADPTDLDAHRVLADVLAAEGDPVGDWMNLELAASVRADPKLRLAARRFAFEHRQALFGPIAHGTLPWRLDVVNGVVRGVEVVARWPGPVELLMGLHERGVLFGVQRIRLVGTTDFDPMARWIVDHVPQLEDLWMGPLSLGYGRLTYPLRALLAGLPRLRQLRLPPCRDVLGAAHGRLEALTWVPSDEQAGVVQRASFPRLISQYVIFRDLESAAALSNVEVKGVAEQSPDHDPLLTPVEQERWRRFTLDGRFWRIRREGSDLNVRWGAVEENTGRRTACRSPYDASTALRERVIAKQKAGWREVFVDEL